MMYVEEFEQTAKKWAATILGSGDHHFLCYRYPKPALAQRAISRLREASKGAWIDMGTKFSADGRSLYVRVATNDAEELTFDVLGEPKNELPLPVGPQARTTSSVQASAPSP